MSKPPPKIDDANVLYWAWSGEQPFFVMPDTEGSPVAEIYGLVIAQYESSGEVYRFSCNVNWETENDSDFGEDLAAAKTTPSGQYDITKVNWQPYQD